MTSRLFFLASTLRIVSLASSGNVHGECYCLHMEVDQLKGALHVEGVSIDGQNVYLISEQIGVIQKYNPSGEGTKLTPYINISHLIEVDPQEDQEIDGLMGFAAHPNFAMNMKLYLYTVRDINGKHYVVISEIEGTDIKSEKVLLAIVHSIGAAKGGQLLFGLDGYLYVFVSDKVLSRTLKGSEAQNVGNLLGTVLRLDVDKLAVADFKLQYYDIPPDNPQKPTWRPEVYSIGLSHPYRCSVDKGDDRGRIFCGDVNDMTAEEIDIIKPGVNYGHPFKEGTTCVMNKSLCDNIENEELPIFSFNRSMGLVFVVIGGPLYRGSQFTSIQRQLIIGDYISGLLFTLEEPAATDNSTTWTLHNFTECSPELCGCNYKSPRLRFLYSIGKTFSDEILLLMTSGLRPGEPKIVLLSLRKPHSTETCGSKDVAYSARCLISALVIAILNKYIPG